MSIWAISEQFLAASHLKGLFSQDVRLQLRTEGASRTRTITAWLVQPPS